MPTCNECNGFKDAQLSQETANRYPRGHCSSHRSTTRCLFNLIFKLLRNINYYSISSPSLSLFHLEVDLFSLIFSVNLVNLILKNKIISKINFREIRTQDVRSATQVIYHAATTTWTIFSNNYVTIVLPNQFINWIIIEMFQSKINKKY